MKSTNLKIESKEHKGYLQDYTKYVSMLKLPK